MSGGATASPARIREPGSVVEALGGLVSGLERVPEHAPFERPTTGAQAQAQVGQLPASEPASHRVITGV